MRHKTDENSHCVSHIRKSQQTVCAVRATYCELLLCDFIYTEVSRIVVMTARAVHSSEYKSTFQYTHFSTLTSVHPRGLSPVPVITDSSINYYSEIHKNQSSSTLESPRSFLGF